MWTSSPNRELGLLTSLNDFIVNLNNKGSFDFPDLSASGKILALSDYGGEHKNSNFYCYSSLIMDFEGISPFSHYITQFRKSFNLEKRKINYKNLNDNIRFRALYPFLQLSNKINGLLVSVLVHKELITLFKNELDFDKPEFQPLKVWHPKTVEKLLRVITLNAFFIAGLSHPTQDIMWITDQDDIVVDDNKLTIITSLFMKSISPLLNHDMGHLRCGRTNIEKDTMFFEDLCSLPDLVSGALVDYMTLQENNGIFPESNLIIAAPKDIKEKINRIIYWLTNKSSAIRLKKLCLVLKPGINNSVNMVYIDFHDLRGYAPDLK